MCSSDLRLSMPMVPDGSQYFAFLIIALSLIAVVYIGLVALMQTDMKKLIAYSSIAHMGFVTLGFFIVWSVAAASGSGAALGVTGGVVQMISHGLVSGALFLCVGVLYDRVHSREIADYGGVANTMPLFAAFMVLFAMANAGLPGTSGFVGEFMVIIASFKANFWYAFFAATTLVLGAAYTLWMVKRVVYGEVANQRVQELQDLNAREFVVLGVLAVAVLYVGLHPAPLKGVHLAICCYPEAHLRPLSDLDVLFTDLEEADRAFNLLVERGYDYEKERITGEPWDMSHQRTALEDPASGFHVEVHGALVYAPRDRRWVNGADCLISDLEAYDYKGLALRGLNREANAVFLSVHTFMQHSKNPAKAVLFYDLKHLLGQHDDDFDWGKMGALAQASGFKAYAARSLAILKEMGWHKAPDDILKRLNGGGRSEEHTSELQSH